MNDTCLLLTTLIVLCFATTLQGKPSTTFKVRLKNDGKVFDEVVNIDVAKETATFHVPSHDGLDEADVIHDFLKKLTLISLPEKQVCYLSQLNENLPRPVQLLDAFKKAATVSYDSQNVQRVKAEMEREELIKDRSELSKAMRKACQNVPIYRIQPVDDSTSETAGETRGHVRRSSCSSEVCYTIVKCYLICPDPSSCLVCKEEKICETIEC